MPVPWPLSQRGGGGGGYAGSDPRIFRSSGGRLSARPTWKCEKLHRSRQRSACHAVWWGRDCCALFQQADAPRAFCGRFLTYRLQWMRIFFMVYCDISCWNSFFLFFVSSYISRVHNFVWDLCVCDRLFFLFFFCCCSCWVFVVAVVSFCLCLGVWG